MVGIFAASLMLQCLAVVLAVRLNWIYCHHRSWWLISLALLLMTIRRAVDFYQFVSLPQPAIPSLIAELVALNVSVLLVVGLWMLDPLFRSIHKAETVLQNQKQELNNLLTQNAIEMGARIGEKNRAEQERRDQNAIYHSLVETLPMSIIRKDLEGRFVFVNSAACRMLDRSSEELIGKTDADLFEKSFAQKYQHDDRRVLDTGESLDEFEEFRDSQGETRQLQILKTPVYDSQKSIVGTQVIFWDVTERRRDIEALARNESIKSAMFEASLECIITIDAEDRIMEFNPASTLAFGYEREEAVGQKMGQLLMPQSGRERHQDNLANYLASGVEGSSMKGRLAVSMKRKDGSLFTAEMSMQPIFLDDSQGFTVFLRDITERQRVAKELARQRKLIEQANTDLQLEVQERRRAENESEMRNRDLQTLLYVISHDLREPLRGIRNFAGLIEERYAEVLDVKGREFLNRIIRGAERLDRQLEDVLTLSRAHRLIDPSEEVSLKDVVDDVLRQLEVRIQETNAQVQVADNLPTVLADRSWVIQAVLNLVVNALKFTKPRTAPEICIKGFESDGSDDLQRGLIVADRGPGVLPEHAERIFELFQRAVGRNVEGTGAGLSIVSRIAERHGGRVWCQPREGGGTEFWLEFGQPPEQ